MKLARLEIENFRHLGSREKPFKVDFTDPLDRVRDFILFVGPNTSGKTTILDAIAAALGSGGGLGIPALRQGFKLSPRTIVRRGELHATVKCWLRFTSDEIATIQNIWKLAESPQDWSEGQEVQLSWTYPDPRKNSKSATSEDFGFVELSPGRSWVLLQSRAKLALLLATGRADWGWFHKVGGVFTFDQERTGLGRTISRQVWNIIHGTTDAAKEHEERQTTDARTMLIDLALQSLVPPMSANGQSSDEFQLIQKKYSEICAPRKIVGAVRDELGAFDIAFNDGNNDYSYDGLSGGEKNVLLFLIRFVAERIHQSIVLIDELELNQHPIWQRRLAHMIPKMGDGNQIIATTHSSYLRDAFSPRAVFELGNLGEVHSAGGES